MEVNHAKTITSNVGQVSVELSKQSMCRVVSSRQLPSQLSDAGVNLSK